MLKIEFSVPIKGALESSLKGLLPEDTEATILEMDQPPRRASLDALNRAVELARAGNPLLMLTFRRFTDWAADLRYHIAMGYPNVEIMRLPIEGKQIAREIRYLMQGELRPADPLAQRLGEVPALNSSVMGTILHDMNHALHDGGNAAEQYDPKWIPMARQLFGESLTREQLIAAVQNAATPGSSKGYFAGQAFPDVCVDVEGTLLTSDGEIRQEIAELVERCAVERPITVWTGGDVTKCRKRLLERGITWKVLPKELLAGASVHAVIDDLPQEEFDRQYGVMYLDYFQV